MNDSFYRAYEDRHRGSRELIKSRLHAYAPFIEPLASLYRSSAALDLGCGRGEWLELLGESGFDACGVDLDEGMLAACRELGLNARKEDALKALQTLPDESMALVSAFHVVEHIPFDMLRSVVREALRVLKPGGLLIFETPNPENLVVGASSFYQDPSHQRPIPPELLSFVVEHAGFSRKRIVRLQEAPELHATSEPRLIDVLNGVSPDYGVVAQKQATQEMLSGFDAAFRASFGLSLDTLAQRYDAQAKSRLADVRRLLSESELRLANSIEHISARTTEVEARCAHLEERAMRAEAQADARSAQLNAILQSHSWRITAPLRYAGGIFRRVRAAAREKRLANATKRRINSLVLNTRLGRTALSMLNHMPRLKQRLRNMMHVHDIQPQVVQQASDLPPRAARIYAELKRNIDARKK